MTSSETLREVTRRMWIVALLLAAVAAAVSLSWPTAGGGAPTNHGASAVEYALLL
ncbi:hypothetical protein WEI85_16425 [Actinomycetes bacterium KLBMP 9797]